jgi:hypothetical protein
MQMGVNAIHIIESLWVNLDFQGFECLSPGIIPILGLDKP